ncbi:hypothetical protein NC651_000138 [Populus alba x Populus x berolinensis]|nr:hypothetical protein NC651_000138 [Populus alba x Populus x berolinensis]
MVTVNAGWYTFSEANRCQYSICLVHNMAIKLKLCFCLVLHECCFGKIMLQLSCHSSVCEKHSVSGVVWWHVKYFPFKERCFFSFLLDVGRARHLISKVCFSWTFLTNGGYFYPCARKDNRLIIFVDEHEGFSTSSCEPLVESLVACIAS